MPTFLEEFQAEFGVSCDQWTLEQWKQAALDGCKAADLLEEEALQREGVIQKTLDLLIAEQVKSNKLRKMLDEAVVRLQGRPRGRPRKGNALARLLVKKLVKKRPPGRPHKVLDQESGFTLADDSAELYRRVERIKSERKISKDTEALRIFHQSVKSKRERDRLVSADAKLLSKHRKKIE